MNNIFDSFIMNSEVDSSTIQKYGNKVPQELLNIWETKGYGSILNGYLRIIDPDKYMSIIQKYYFKGKESIPILSTSFGDIIVWQENKYISIVNFKNHSYNIISSGFKYFWHDLTDSAFRKDFFDEELHEEVVQQVGIANYNQIYGFFPLLPISNDNNISNIKIVNTVEHLEIIGKMFGCINN